MSAPISTVRFNDREQVLIRNGYPIGHYRTPKYARDKPGTIERYCGAFPNPEELAYGRDGLPKVNLYRVRVRQIDLWPTYDGPNHDTVDIEIFEHWLEPVKDST